MAVTVQQNLVGRLRELGPVMLQVHCAAGQEAAAAAGAARAGVAPAGDRAPHIGEPIPVPGGWVLPVDTSGSPPDVAAAIPGLIARHLKEAGVGEADIGLAPEIGDRYDVFSRLSPVAQAWLSGTRDSRIGLRVMPSADPRLADLAAEWIPGEHRDGMTMLALARVAEIPVTPGTIRPVVRGILSAARRATVITSDFSSAVASAAVGAFFGIGLALAAAGADRPSAEVARHMRGQRDLIRAHAQGLAWAGVTAHTDTRYFILGAVSGPRTPPPVPGQAWYQLLSAEQTRALGGPPEGSVPLAGGQVELIIGEPEQWVPGHPDRYAVEDEARRILGISDEG